MKVLDKPFWIGILVTVAIIILATVASELAPAGDFAGSSLGIGGNIAFCGLVLAFFTSGMTFFYVLIRLIDKYILSRRKPNVPQR